MGARATISAATSSDKPLNLLQTHLCENTGKVVSALQKHYQDIGDRAINSKGLLSIKSLLNDVWIFGKEDTDKFRGFTSITNCHGRCEAWEGKEYPYKNA